MNIALIAEYVTLAKSLMLDKKKAVPTFADFARANALATQCMIELPTDVWQQVIDAIKSPTWEGVFILMERLRAIVCPGDPLDRETQIVSHGLEPPKYAGKH